MRKGFAMATYEIVKPCVYVDDDGAVVQHSKPGAFVSLSERLARELGASVRKINTSEAAADEGGDSDSGDEAPAPAKSDRKPKTGRPGPAEKTQNEPAGPGDQPPVDPPDAGADG